jgi:hypothetical protein
MTRINADKDNKRCEGFEKQTHSIDSAPFVRASEFTLRAVLSALIRSYPRVIRVIRVKK